MNRTSIDSNGRLALPFYAAKELGSRSLELASYSAGHLLVIDPDRRVQLAGRLGDFGLVDLMSFFNMFRKTGVLCLELKGGRKEVYFKLGEIVFATSTFAEEHLCEILYDQGKLDRDALHRARQLAGSQTQVGKCLVEKKIITAKDLWLASRYQVEVSIYNLFLATEGSFYYEEREAEEDQAVRLSTSTQNLIMEGLRRIDERALFMRQIRSLETIPVPTGKEVANLSEQEKAMLEVVGRGRLNVKSALRRSGVAELEGLRLLHQLIGKGLVRIEDAPSFDIGGDIGEMLKIFNGVLVLLYRRIIQNNPRFSDELRNFLRVVPSPFSYVFRDVALLDDGSVDGGRVLANLAGLEDRDKKKLLAEALTELVYMECHAARRDLGNAASAELLQRVQDIPRRIKNILERKS
jgi:hypothetical protein